MKKEYINITKENKLDIIRSYAHNMIEDMDIDTLYSFTYRLLVHSKGLMNNKDLTKEIMAHYPHILEYAP